ncbi:MAG: hypothetical protein ACYTFW_21395, partial [Planctomycetota bacterium]
VVVWFVLNSWVVPCPDPADTVDEFGREFQTLVTTTQACWDSESKRMSKEFDSRINAELFMARAKRECGDCSEFKLFREVDFQ